MRHHRSALLVTGLFLASLGVCAAESMLSTSEPPTTSQVAQAQGQPAQPPSGAVQEPGSAQPSPGTTSPPTGGEPAPGEPPVGEVQERAVLPGRDLGQTLQQNLVNLPPVPFPGEFAVRTLKGFYVTAIEGGGRITDPILVTASPTAGPWEKFK